MQLKFEIRKQNIIRTDCEKPVADSRNYLFAHFDFLTDEWSGITKSANFWHNGKAYTVILDENGDTVVPWEVIKEGIFEVSCFGSNLITNDRARVLVKRSGYKQGETPQPPTPDVYQTILENYQRLNGIIKTDGSGENYLADDGTYKPIAGGDSTIDHIQLNGVEQAIENKTVNLPLPNATKLLGANYQLEQMNVGYYLAGRNLYIARTESSISSAILIPAGVLFYVGETTSVGEEHRKTIVYINSGGKFCYCDNTHDILSTGEDELVNSKKLTDEVANALREYTKTVDLPTKLSDFEDDTELLSGVSVNGQSLPVTDKAVNIPLGADMEFADGVLNAKVVKNYNDLQNIAVKNLELGTTVNPTVLFDLETGAYRIIKTGSIALMNDDGSLRFRKTFYIGDIISIFNPSATTPIKGATIQAHDGFYIFTPDTQTVDEAKLVVPAKVNEINDDNKHSVELIATLEAISSYVDRALVDIQTYEGINMYPHGNPSVNMGIASNFTVNDYLQFPKIVTIGPKPFELKFAITTGEGSLVDQQNIIDSNFGMAFAIQNSKFVIVMSSNGTGWNITNGARYGTITLQSLTPYYVKITWDGLNTYKVQVSTDDINYIDDIVVTTQTVMSLYPRPMFVGVGNLFFEAPKNYFKGSINFNECYLNLEDERFWTGTKEKKASVDLYNITDKGVDVIRNSVNIKGVIDMTEHNSVETRLKLDQDITEDGEYLLLNSGYIGIPGTTDSKKRIYVTGGTTRLIFNNEADSVTIIGQDCYTIAFRNVTTIYDWANAKLVTLEYAQGRPILDIDLISQSAYIAIADNHDYGRGTLENLTISLPSLTESDRALSFLSFKSGTTPTALTYPYSTKWLGDDLADGLFAPVANKDYELSFSWNGSFWTGIVNGFEVVV